MGNLHEVFLRKFANQFLPGFIESTVQNILESPKENLRNLKFKKAIIDDISKNLSLLAKRCMSIGQKNDLIENFNLDVAWMFFNSEFINKKVQGFAMILDILKSIKLEEYKVLTEATFVNHINFSYYKENMG